MHLVLNEYGVKHVIVANVTVVGLVLALIKTKSKRADCTKLTQSFNTKLANNLDYMKKDADLEIKAFDLNSRMKSMLGKYKSKGLNDQDAYLSNIVDQFGGEGDLEKV